LSRFSAGLVVHGVDEPRRFGIAFLKPDGTLDRLVEKPPMDGRQLANAGAYVFPSAVLKEELELSARGEYEITDYVSRLAARGPFHVVESTFWLPIGTEQIWQQAQEMDLDAVMTRTPKLT
jgi:bifunctional UDP-N-acetylglucosamine pyrophosphorylase/glucosamine-1-phosphate N-acetyltransferase